MIDLSRVQKYYVACGYTDLRRGIDGLAAIVSQQFGKDLCEDRRTFMLSYHGVQRCRLSVL